MSGTGIEVAAPLLMEAVPQKSPNYLLGHVRIIFDKRHLNTQRNVLLRNTVLLGGAFLLIGALFSFLLAAQISRPLKWLTEGVKRYGEKGVCENLPVETKNEIGNLARSFQKMVDALAKREAEKKKIEQQLRQTQKLEAIGTLSGGIAHDFNNILGIISGYTELALVDVPEGSDAQQCLSEVFKASGRAQGLVHQILTFSRQGEKENRPLQIGSIVKEVLKMLRATMPATIDIKSYIDKSLPAIIADPAQIHQVMMNLCTNAGHAMREQGGLLEVGLTQQQVDTRTAGALSVPNPGLYQKLTIRDTGHGMSQDVINRIFDPFFTTKGHEQGTGLGLSVVHGVVKNHEGAIKVTSEPGKGTVFEVYFPSMEFQKDDSETVLPPLSTGTERILLVDDELALVNMGTAMLESLGYTVSSRSSSVEALAAFRDHPDAFDLVITDMTMPKMTGAELAREILKICPDIPIILCTGFSETIQEETAKSIGIREFVMKPILRREIAQIIRRVLPEPANG
ncbi:MAG: response regulator [Deltaproteobacteria bacterium]|nr:response regulator [Deltaproteobacteria bacterium]